MTLDEYLKYVGYPGSYSYMRNKKRFEDYIQNSIISTIIEKDLLVENKVRNSALFKQTFQVLQNLPATEISYTKLLGQLHLVGADLIRSDIEVFYWRESDYEIDFVFEYRNKLIAIEVKSGKRKSSKSVPEFRKRYPKAHVVYINEGNYEKFSLDPIGFVEKFVE